MEDIAKCSIIHLPRFHRRARNKALHLMITPQESFLTALTTITAGTIAIIGALCRGSHHIYVSPILYGLSAPAIAGITHLLL